MKRVQFFLDPSNGQVKFFPKWSIQMSSGCFPVVFSASRRFFWPIKNNYWRRKNQIFHHKGGPFWFRGGQELRKWLLGLKTQNRFFYSIDPTWKNPTGYDWFRHLLSICLYLIYSILIWFRPGYLHLFIIFCFIPVDTKYPWIKEYITCLGLAKR